MEQEMSAKYLLCLIICYFFNTNAVACFDVKNPEERLKCYDKIERSVAPSKSADVQEKNEVGFATLSGTITYQYNNYVGTKPDVNSSIKVIRREIIKPISLRMDDIANWPSNYVGFFGSDMSSKMYAGYDAKADGYGNYRIEKITPGSYLIIVISSKTQVGYSSEDMDFRTKQCLEDTYSFFEDSLKDFEGHKLYCKEIKIEKNDNVTLSYDFGNTYF